MRAKLLFLAVSALVVSASLVAQGLPDPTDESQSATDRLLALVERMKLEQKGIETLQASFSQTTRSELLLEDEESKGYFYYQAPDKVRWEYSEPTPKVVVINGVNLVTWYKDLGRAERRRVGRYSDAVFKYLGASGSLETLMDYFALIVRWPESQDDPYRVRLEPRYARVEKRLKEMSLAVHGDLYVPVELRYVEPSGDSSEYLFTGFRFNEEIPEDRFSVDLPPDVDVRVVSGG
ncbi:MAG: outer membrane lipoprotein carrier protein LolA [Acidobacteriota bacterium]|nr:outer membrane lipoprotein carrier protein LolA [Acidobacteriota bacterium]